MNVGNGRERADITDSGRDRRSASAHTPKSTVARSQDHLGAESLAPQRPQHTSPMTVEHALGIPFFYKFPERVPSVTMGHSSCILDVQGKVTDQLSQANLSFLRSGICAITSWNLGACT